MSEVKIIKEKNGKVTKLEYDGEVYILLAKDSFKNKKHKKVAK